MTLIQPVLIFLLVAAAVFYHARLRSRLLDRALVLVLAGTGIVLISSPDLSTAIAHRVGVGRGADLVMYISLLGIGFLLLLLLSRIRVLEAHITTLTRELAVWRANTEESRSQKLGEK